MNEKRDFIPTQEIYSKTCTKLVEQNSMTTLIAIRLGCECGMSRIEIVNAKITDIDRINSRGLWVEIAKHVRRGKRKHGRGFIPVYKMRQREIPVNANLYQLLRAYTKNSSVYILHREKGNDTSPFIPRYINTLYERSNIEWSPHKSRHYFKSNVWSWMQKNRQVDTGLMKELLGHKKDTTESYGEYSWDYKQEVLDNVFK